MAGKMITVSTTQELYSALATCKGGETILLEGGEYGALDLSAYMKPPVNIDFSSMVTIASADPSDPAVFSQARVTSASNLAFEGVTFDYTFKPGDPVWISPFTFTDCDSLTIRNCTFDGDLASGTGRLADDGYGCGNGVSVRGSSNVLVEGNEVYDFYRGMTFGENSDTIVRSNEVYSVRSDGMTFAEMDGVVIEKNYIHDFRASPSSTDHCDMIQFWTAGTDKPTSDVIIRDNILDIGQGSPTQTIFMRNDLVDTKQASFADMAYRNVLIENNTITNAHLHGITVGETAGLTIRQNTVVHADGANVDGADSSVEIPRINVASTSTGVTVIGNVTSALTGWSSQPGWTIKNNAFVQDQDPHAPGYYKDVFVGSSLQPGADGSHHFLALAGAMIDKLGAGSETIQPEDTGLQLLFHVDETNEATRVFDARASTLDGGALPAGTTYLWDFGDGTSAKGQAVNHSYVDGGDYKVTLTVTLPNGIKASEAIAVDVEGPEILTMDGSGRFTAYENGDPIALGGIAKTTTADGLQLGATGTSATVARGHVVDVVGADDMTIAFSLDADRAGSSGELFRLHGSFVVNVTTKGELQVSIMRDGAPTLTCVTKGAALNTVVGQDHDVVIHLDDGQLQLWVDGKLGGQLAVPGVVGGATGFGSHSLVFGNPWGQANFNGDLSDFELSVGADAFPDKPQTVVMSSMAQDSDERVEPTHDLPGLDLLREAWGSAEGRADLRDAFHDLPDTTQDRIFEAHHDRFVQMLQDRFDVHAA